MTTEHDTSRSPQTDRRRFLKSSAVGAATVTGLALARSAYAAGDGTIRIGMIGRGGRGTGAGQSLKAGPDVKLVAMSTGRHWRPFSHCAGESGPVEKTDCQEEMSVTIKIR